MTPKTEAASLGEQAAAEEVTELRAQVEAWRKLCDTLKHQVICCGVAASHPDAALTTRGAYAGKWNSAQAEEVRKLRAERDRLVALATSEPPAPQAHDREAFEKAAKSLPLRDGESPRYHFRLERDDETGAYVYHSDHHAWELWKIAISTQAVGERLPLTDEQLWEIWGQSVEDTTVRDYLQLGHISAFARAIEAAHNIKALKEPAYDPPRVLAHP